MPWRDWLNRMAWARRRQTSTGRIVALHELAAGLGQPPSQTLAQEERRTDREAALLAAYPTLASWPAELPEMVRCESLARLSLLHDHLPATAAGSRWLDVGSKNAAAAFGIATLAAHRCSTPLQLDLVELDAGRRYRGGLRRIDHGVTLADAITRWLGGSHKVRYVASDVRERQGLYDVITWSLPFLFAEPHQAWGLPLSLLDPEGLLIAVANLLAPGGHLLIVNLNQSEAERQRQLLREMPLDRITESAAPLYWLHPERQLPVHVLRRST